MFAFAIVEHASGRLVLARDRLGIKPLYLDHTRDRLRFASTLPALLAAGGVDTSIDRTALAYYMTFHSVVPAPHTILTGVRKLPPATVRVDRARRQLARHRLLGARRSPATRTARDWTARDWEEALLETLRVAVERRMVADVPVGVLLSGGIDSSLVVALLAEAGQTGLQTFSIGFESAGGESGDEFEYSTLVAQRFGTDHHRIQIDIAPAAARHRRRGRGDERADGQPRLRRVLPAQRGGLQDTSRSCSPGRAPTRCSAATTGTRRWPACRATDAVEAYSRGVLRPALVRRWPTS